MPPAPGPDRPAGRPGWAVVLAGGSGSRLGLVDKPALRLGSVSLLEIALTAVAPARTVVVGPGRALPPEIWQTREDPPGGGPAAAVAAGVEFLVSRAGPAAPGEQAVSALVVLLAADLPGIDARSIDLLTTAVAGRDLPGAVLVDPAGRSQYLAGVWRMQGLLDRCRSRSSWHGARLSDLLTPLIGDRLPVDRRASADLDVPADLAEWGVELPGG